MISKNNSKISLSSSNFATTDLFGNTIKNPEVLKSSGLLCFGIMKDKVNIGNTILWKLDEKTIQIDTIYIKKEYRNKGYGSLALKEIIKKYNKYNICLNGVKEAKKFYERNGFKIICFRKDSQCYEFELIQNKAKTR